MEPTNIEDVLVRSLQGRTSPEEERALARWRTVAPENEAHYQLLSNAWIMTARHIPPAGEGPPPLSQVLGVVRTKRSAVRHRLARGAVAAALLLVSLGGGYAVSQWRVGRVATRDAQPQVVATGVGERATVTLPDGTVARLGERTTLSVSQVGRATEAWLEGRAFFGVHPDSSRTFTVRTERGVASVLGTRFEVRTEANELHVAVLQGGVKVTSGGAEVRVGEGEVSRSAPGSTPLAVRVLGTEELLNRLAWMGPVLVFRRTPLERAIAEIAHRYHVDVFLEDQSLAQLPVTGVLSDLPAGEALEVICEIVQASCLREAAGFRIGGPDRTVPRAGG